MSYLREDIFFVPLDTLRRFARGEAFDLKGMVAREYGVPAVIGVHNATSRLKTGERVRVDGTRGRVTVLDGEEAKIAESHTPS